MSLTLPPRCEARQLLSHRSRKFAVKALSRISLNPVEMHTHAIPQVASLGCKVCSQSTAGHCQKLSETFRVADGHVKAAWCNDKYMVVAAESLPAYDAAEALQGIPLPPGGDDVCRVRTAAPQLNVFKVASIQQSPMLKPQTQNSTATAHSYMRPRFPLLQVPLNPTAVDGVNSVPTPLPNVPGMPEAGATAVAVDGVPIL